MQRSATLTFSEALITLGNSLIPRPNELGNEATCTWVEVHDDVIVQSCLNKIVLVSLSCI